MRVRPVKRQLHDYRSSYRARRGATARTGRRANLSTHMKNCLSMISVTRRRCIRTAMRFIQLWRVVCKNEDVTAKAEIPPKHAEDVAFAPAVGDNTPLDESHILDMQKGKAELKRRNGREQRSAESDV